MASRSLPPDDKREEWIKRNAAILAQVLNSPDLRTRILELLDNQPRANDENT